MNEMHDVSESSEVNGSQGGSIEHSSDGSFEADYEKAKLDNNADSTSEKERLSETAEKSSSESFEGDYEKTKLAHSTKAEHENGDSRESSERTNDDSVDSAYGRKDIAQDETADSLNKPERGPFDEHVLEGKSKEELQEMRNNYREWDKRLEEEYPGLSDEHREALKDKIINDDELRNSYLGPFGEIDDDSPDDSQKVNVRTR